MKEPTTVYETRQYAFDKVEELGLTVNELVDITGLSKINY